jgi:hypothetical protein
MEILQFAFLSNADGGGMVPANICGDGVLCADRNN